MDLNPYVFCDWCRDQTYGSSCVLLERGAQLTTYDFGFMIIRLQINLIALYYDQQKRKKWATIENKISKIVWRGFNRTNSCNEMWFVKTPTRLCLVNLVIIFFIPILKIWIFWFFEWKSFLNKIYINVKIGKWQFIKLCRFQIFCFRYLPIFSIFLLTKL
jgi:hypothetical protein